MSFEGFYQNICENGHYFTSPCSYAFLEEDEECIECGAKAAWSNLVNDTNCDRVGYIPEKLLKKLQWGKVAIPTKEETKKLQTYTDWGGHSGGEVRIFYCETEKQIKPPKYKMCEYDTSMCHLSYLNSLCRQPQNNLCV